MLENLGAFWATALVSGILLLAVGGILLSAAKRRKKGKSACCGDCTRCRGCGR